MYRSDPHGVRFRPRTRCRHIWARVLGPKQALGTSQSRMDTRSDSYKPEYLKILCDSRGEAINVPITFFFIRKRIMAARSLADQYVRKT